MRTQLLSVACFESSENFLGSHVLSLLDTLTTTWLSPKLQLSTSWVCLWHFLRKKRIYKTWDLSLNLLLADVPADGVTLRTSSRRPTYSSPIFGHKPPALKFYSWLLQNLNLSCTQSGSVFTRPFSMMTTSINNSINNRQTLHFCRQYLNFHFFFLISHQKFDSDNPAQLK